MSETVFPFSRTHNQPPPTEVAAEHLPRVSDIVAAANTWARQVPFPRTEAEGGKLEDFIGQVRKERKAVDDARKVEKKPHDDAGDAVQAAFAPLLNLLDACADALGPLKRRYLEYREALLEEARKKAAEEARAAPEAAELAAAAAAARLAPPVEGALAIEETQAAADEAQARVENLAAARPMISGELSGRASGFVVTWAAKITDLEKAAVAFCRNTKVAEAIQQAANAQAKVQKQNFAAAGCEVVKGRRI